MYVDKDGYRHMEDGTVKPPLKMLDVQLDVDEESANWIHNLEKDPDKEPLREEKSKEFEK